MENILSMSNNEILLKYDDKLKSSRKGFVRMTMTEFRELKPVYEDIFKTKINKSQELCTHCVLTILKKLDEYCELNRVRKELEPKMQIAENEENNNKEKKVVSNGQKSKHKRSTKTRDNEESGQSEQT